MSWKSEEERGDRAESALYSGPCPPGAREEALQESERKYPFLFEERPGISVMIGRDGLLKNVNNYTLEIFGYQKDEVIGRHFTEFLPPDTREEALREVEKAFQGEDTSWGEVEILAKNGLIHTVLFSPSRLVVEEEDSLPSIQFTGVDICERRQAEEVLLKAQQAADFERARIETILKIVPASVVIIEKPDGKITYVNDRAVELYGMDPRGLSLEEHSLTLRLLKPDGRMYPSEELPLNRALLHGEEIYDEELVIERFDGSLVTVLENAVPIYSPSGEIVAAVGTFHDVTDRKRVIEALRKSEARFRTSAEHLPDCFGIYSAVRDESGSIIDFKIDYVNHTACTVAQLSAKEQIGKHLCELQPAYRDSGLFDDYCQVVETGEPLSEESILEDADGDRPNRIFDIRAAKLGDGLVILWHEITARVQTEEELRNTSSYLENLITYANAPIIVWDADYKITRFNHAFEHLSGHRAEDVLNAPLDILLPEPKREETMNHIRRTLAGERWEALEVPVLRKDGTVRDVIWNSANIYDGTTVTATIAQGYDITEQKRAEERLRISLEEKETLLRELHHRVKNNLQLVSSLLILQAQQTSDPSAFAAYNEIQNRIRSMALIHAKLYQAEDLAKIDFTKYLQELTTALIHSYGISTDRVSLTLNTSGVMLNLNTAVPLGLIVNELVSNCLKHAFPGNRSGEILIDLQGEDDGSYLLRVADNGIGLPEGLDITNTATLGLQLVNTLVEQLKGTFEFERGAGAGTTFIIQFQERV
jgi:PAS domain S-box-containing protein